MESRDICRVRIEFKRIQTYLFAVPRLRTILGANALIGETLRQHLAQAAADAGAQLPAGVPVPPDLAKWRCSVIGPSSAARSDEPWRTWSADHPAESYGQGILTRDGGHFQALFGGVGSAEGFAERAKALITQHVPGVMTAIQIERWVDANGSAVALAAAG